MNYRIEYRIDNYMSTHYKFVQAHDTDQAEQQFQQAIDEQIPEANVNIVEMSLVVEKNDTIVTIPA